MPIYNCTDNEMIKVMNELNDEVANGELSIYFPIVDAPIFHGVFIRLEHPTERGIFVHAIEVFERFTASHDDPVIKMIKPLLKEWYQKAKKTLDDYKKPKEKNVKNRDKVKIQTNKRQGIDKD